MSYKIIGKYIKDLNFSIPNPKTFSLLSKDITNYKINIDIKSNRIKENIIEVLTSLTLTPVKENFEKINTRIVFSAIIELPYNEMKNDEIENIILVKVPTEIYGELRNIFVYLFERSGFKDVKINKSIDFQKLYTLKKSQ